jgi:hypothetical protein
MKKGKRSVLGRLWRARSGQMEVETAIVLPAVVFLMLGLLQLGLLNQARLMAKYAAYMAVRTGVLHNMDDEAMRKAGLAAALPVLSFKEGAAEALLRTDTQSFWIAKWERLQLNQMLDVPGMKYVEVTVCAPLQGDLSNALYDDNTVAFDSPALAVDSSEGGLSSKVRIELTLNYRMIVPFANWLISSMWLGRDYNKDLRLGKKDPLSVPTVNKYSVAHDLGVFIIPLRAHYSMVLQSDSPQDKFPDSNECIVQ